MARVSRTFPHGALLEAYLASSSEEEAEAKGKQTRAQELKALVACSEDEGDEGGAGGAGEGGSEGSGSESDFGTRKKQPEGDMEAGLPDVVFLRTERLDHPCVFKCRN